MSTCPPTHSPANHLEPGYSGASAVEFRGITKSFGNVVANAGLNLRIESGTIHGIIGENGAGKSTAMKILYGLVRPDAGEILVRGRRCNWTSPSDSIAEGIGMVHQHFMLAGPFTALDNVLLGAEPVRRGLLDRQTARSRLEAIAHQHGLAMDWDIPVDQLPVGLQQRIEILKLLFRDANILILDEPTAVLTPQQTKDLFDNLRRLKKSGKTILLVTHKLKEVLAITDRVTVLRAGQVTGHFETTRTNAEELARCMIGRTVMLNASYPPGRPSAELALEVGGLTIIDKSEARPRLSGITLSVRRGEIIGIAGVEGNGQSELLEALLHPREFGRRLSGRILVLGKDVTTWRSKAIRQLGVAMVPEDRLRDALLPRAPVAQSFLLGLHCTPGFSRAGWLCAEEVRKAAFRALDAYDIRPRDLSLKTNQLSGGNQQKLIIAREFFGHPDLVIAAQPTRGVDIGAVELIRRRIIEARDRGAGVLLISSELEELLALADRILVLFEGRFVAEFQRGSVSEQELGLKMGGG